MDPWSTNTNIPTNNDEITGFQDSFCQYDQSAHNFNLTAPMEHNRNNFHLTSEEYLQKLERKLSKVQNSREKENKVSASFIIDSLRSQKNSYFENALNENSMYSGYDDYDDFPCINKSSIQNEIQRKFNPEQQALSQVELLCLPENDVLSNVSSNTNIFDDRSDSSSDGPDH